MYTFDISRKRAELHPDRIALVDATSGGQITYRELDDRASRLAEAMRETYGLAAGDRVAMLCQHSCAFYETLFACAKAELTLVPLNWRLAVSEQLYVLGDAQPRLLIYDSTFAAAAQAIAGMMPGIASLAIGAAGGGDDPYEAALAGASGRPYVMRERQLDDLWYIIYTSGTTGRPKGVLQTFAMALVNYLNIGLPSSLTQDDATLNVLPHFHVGGINLYTLPTLIAGGTAYLQRTFDPAAALALLSTKVDVFFGVPAIYAALRQDPAYDPARLRRVRVFASGGAPMPVRLIQQFAEDGIEIQQGFGMTETGPTVFLMDRSQAVRKAGSVGRPQLFVSVRVADRDGRDVPQGQSGELLIKGPGVTPGYWGRPDLAVEAFTPDGWLHTGDVARCDDDGYYYIVDRWKDMFISGGENVYPAEVEAVLYEHPAVVEAAVVGVPDERWGEVGRAFVVPKAGEAPDAAELTRFCQERLARFKVPRSVTFVDALPRNAAGKVVKHALRSGGGE